MHSLLDVLILTCMGLAQWDLARHVMIWAQRRGVPRPRVLAACAVFYVIMAAGFVLSVSEMVSALRLPPIPAAIAGAVIYSWLLASTAGWVIYRLVRTGARRVPFDASRRGAIHAAGAALAGVPFGVLAYGAVVQRKDFHVREVDVPIPGLPDDLAGLRLLQLSDIHLSAFLSERDLARVIDQSNELRPHLALVTGDMISVRGDPLDACLRELARLKADAGVLGCLGNHEVYAGAEDYATRQGARLGIRYLRHQAVPLRFGSATLNLAGVDYEPFSHRRYYLRGAEKLRRPGAVNVLLSHNPDVFPAAARKGYNLTVSGHTHGGQVTVEILNQSINPARFFTPYVYGLFESGGACAYVTRGIGTIGIPVRVGAPPEIAILRLRKA